jgi:hypothetical protein
MAIEGGDGEYVESGSVIAAPIGGGGCRCYVAAAMAIRRRYSFPLLGSKRFK